MQTRSRPPGAGRSCNPLLSSGQIRAFQEKILAHYADAGRSFAWRRTRSPYRILVSEVMLQQTQTERVKEYYRRFLLRFPTVDALAAAPLAAVLKEWQGLGYNRRAKALREAAIMIVRQHGGRIPREEAHLVDLPGVGVYTARAVLAFAYNTPTVLLETNIRTVYLHTFFRDKMGVSDEALSYLIKRTVYDRDPRRWYYALMDYGVTLKGKIPGINKQSKHYRAQSAFHGSNRQIRGTLLKVVAHGGKITRAALKNSVAFPASRVEAQIDALVAEGFFVTVGGKLQLS